MDVNGMVIKEFLALDRLGWNEDVGAFDSIVIVPMKRSFWSGVWYKVKGKAATLLKLNGWIGIERGIHDSGYRAMSLVPVKAGEPLGLIGGGSDLIHIEGIGGYGHNWLERLGEVPKTAKIVGWTIDCLPTSGLLRLFCHRPMLAGEALSSFEIYSQPLDDNVVQETLAISEDVTADEDEEEYERDNGRKPHGRNGA